MSLYLKKKKQATVVVEGAIGARADTIGVLDNGNLPTTLNSVLPHSGDLVMVSLLLGTCVFFLVVNSLLIVGANKVCSL